MSFPQVVSVTATTDASGDATVYTDNIRGSIVAVQYVKSDYDNTADFTITTEATAQTVWTQANVTASDFVYPKRLNDDTAGTALTGVYDYVRAYNERIKVVVAQGGNVKSGTFRVYYE